MRLVTDYGAVGDGVKDDTAAIQVAIDAAPGVGDVVFPVGSYRITEPLRGRSGVRLLGEGVEQSEHDPLGSVLLCGSSESAIEFRADGRQSVSSAFIVERLKLMGSSSSGHGVVMQRGRLCEVKRCHIVGFGGDGVRLEGAVSNEVSGCRIQRCGNGVNLCEDSTTVTVRMSHIEDHREAGVRVIDSDQIRVKDCTIESNDGRGVWVQNRANQFVCVDCWFESNNQVDTGDEDMLLQGAGVSRVRVAGNRFNSAGVSVALRLDGCSEGMFEVNTFSRLDRTNVEILEGSNDNLFLWNKFFGPFEDAGIRNVRVDPDQNDWVC